MATGDSQARYGREMLDSPPPKPRLRTLSGADRGASKPPATPSDSSLVLNSPEGEVTDVDPSESSELDSHPVVQGFEYAGKAFLYLEMLGTVMPNTMLVVQDFVANLKIMVAQEAAAMLSGSADPSLGGVGGAGLAGAPPLGPAGGQPMSGLQMLAGGGAGMGGPASQPVAPSPGMPM